jgi:hypothetical protein
MSQTDISNSNSNPHLLPELTKEELDKITLKPEVIEHYSQPDELKKLLVERELYKRSFEEQSKRITEFQTKFNDIMETPVRNEYGRTQSLRSYCHEKYFEQVFNDIVKKMTYDKHEIKRFNINFDKCYFTRIKY